MALVHDFFLIPPEITNQMIPFREHYMKHGKMERYPCFEAVPKPLDCIADNAAGEILMGFYIPNRSQATRVNDKYILKNILEFKTVETFFTGYIPCMGLNYYGFTMIPLEAIPSFMDVLNHNSVRNCYRELISLCEEAASRKCDVLHCGI